MYMIRTRAQPFKINYPIPGIPRDIEDLYADCGLNQETNHVDHDDSASYQEVVESPIVM